MTAACPMSKRAGHAAAGPAIKRPQPSGLFDWRGGYEVKSV